MPKHETLASLQEAAPAVLPSLLLCDFANLEREVRALEEAGAPGLHLDIMDGHFVPNFTYGLPIVEALRRITALPLDAHLMIANPERHAKDFVRAGADVVTIHVEAAEDPRPILEEVRSLGAAAGLAINPSTDLAAVEPYLQACDMLLVMSVHPGYGGQDFDEVALEKLRRLRAALGPDVPLEVDGGINEQTIARCAEAGADFFVVGSAIFRSPDYARSINTLRRLAQSV